MDEKSLVHGSFVAVAAATLLAGGVGAASADGLAALPPAVDGDTLRSLQPEDGGTRRPVECSA